MNNDNNNNLFDIFGVEQPTDHSVPQNDIVSPVPSEHVNNSENVEPIHSVSNPPTNELNYKPVPDEIMDEIRENSKKVINPDEEFMRLYIGPNYEKIVCGGYSYCTLFFGLYYLFYRKQYKLVLPLFCLQLGVALASCFLLERLWYLLLIVNLVVCFVLGISFKQNYISNAEGVISEISNNNSLSENDKKEAIRKAGGVDKRVIILIIVLSCISVILNTVSQKIISNKYSNDFEIHFPEEFKGFEVDAQNNSISYQVGQYTYAEMPLDYRTSDNVCNYKFHTNDEYVASNKDKMEVAKKYMVDKHSLDVDLEEVSFQDNSYLYYYDEKSKTDYYLYISDKWCTEIYVEYVKDTNKKCHEYTEYILTSSKYVK